MSERHDEIPDGHLPPPVDSSSVTLLRPADCEAIDRLMDARSRGDAEPVEAPTVSTGSHAAAWLSLLRADPAEPPEPGLVERTMQRLADERQRRRFALQIAALARDLPPAQGPGRGFGFQWRELATAAAVILIGLSLALPVLDRSRADARRLTCAANLAAAGFGMNQYAADHAGVMPRRAVRPGDDWFRVGQTVAPGQPVQSNTAHLYLLIRTRHVRPDALNCPDNEHAPWRTTARLLAADDWSTPQAVSYSYQNQFTAEPIRVDRAPNLAVLADKNPLFVIQVNRLDFDAAQAPTATSRFHSRVGPGQNMLTVSGSVTFTPSPLVPKHDDVLADNIWLVDTRPARAGYRGNESPETPSRDAFLVP